MTKLHTKNRQLTSRRAVAPVIATLLLVAIAVVGGSIIFVFSQGFFSSAQISGSPQIESIEVVGYDATDVTGLVMHDGIASGATDGAANDGLVTDEHVAVYVQNQSSQRVTLEEVRFAGTLYSYESTAAALENFGGAVFVAGEYKIATKGVTGSPAVTKTDVLPVLEAGEEATIIFALDGGISAGRDAQFKIETANGAIFVGTVIAGQQSG